MLSDRRVRARLAQIPSIRIVTTYDIPYVAGYSEDAKTIFIDRHLKTKMGSVDIERLLAAHEVAEKAMIDYFNLGYSEAHTIALQVERQYAENRGIDWAKYNRFLAPQMKQINHRRVTSVPRELDITPYQDERDYELLKRMKQHAR